MWQKVTETDEHFANVAITFCILNEFDTKLLTEPRFQKTCLSDC